MHKYYPLDLATNECVLDEVLSFDTVVQKEGAVYRDEPLVVSILIKNNETIKLAGSFSLDVSGCLNNSLLSSVREKSGLEKCPDRLSEVEYTFHLQLLEDDVQVQDEERSCGSLDTSYNKFENSRNNSFSRITLRSKKKDDMLIFDDVGDGKKDAFKELFADFEEESRPNIRLNTSRNASRSRSRSNIKLTFKDASYSTKLVPLDASEGLNAKKPAGLGATPVAREEPSTALKQTSTLSGEQPSAGAGKEPGFRRTLEPQTGLSLSSFGSKDIHRSNPAPPPSTKPITSSNISFGNGYSPDSDIGAILRQQHESELASLKERHAKDLEALNSHHRGDLESLQSEASRWQQLFEREMKARKEDESRHAELRSQLDSLAAENAELRAGSERRLKELSGQLEAANMKVLTLEDQNNDLNEENKKLKERKEGFTLDDLSNDSDEENNKMITMGEALAMAEELQEKHKEEINTLLEELDDLKTELKSKAAAKESYDNNLKKILGIINKQTAEKKELSLERDALAQELAAAKKVDTVRIAKQITQYKK